jgi:cell division cycle 2-like protein
MAELLAGKPLFDGDDDGDQLCQIFDVLGLPGYSTWPAYKSLPLAGKLVKLPRDIRSCNRLRKLLPEGRLSRQGFQVLRKLLSCNIDNRLSASAALRHPWFTDDALS